MNTYCDPTERDYCGGTWKGVERNLGYIQQMGFDTSRSGDMAKEAIAEGSLDIACGCKCGERR